MNVFSYWENAPGATPPPYITECLASIRRHTAADCLYRHVTPENFEAFGLDKVLHPRWRSIKELGVKSDCVRVALLAQFGGLYVDADTVMLTPPTGVIPEECDCAYLVWTNQPRRVIAGYVYMRPGSPVAQEWLRNVNAMLEQGRCGWTDLGERCLTPAVDKHLEFSHQLPLDTFLPIEIDCEVARFFTPDDFRSLVKPHTVAFGLNHSWMMSRQRRVMEAPPQRHAIGNLLVERLLTANRVTLRQPPKITVCCVTYRRPELLAKLIDAFEKQTYPNRELLILDDSGELNECSGDRWRLISSTERSPSLGAKRNRLARLVSPDTVGIVPWDDDDIPAPWAINAVAAGLRHGEWVRPSLALVPAHGGVTFWPVETFARADRSDKAFHSSWAYTPGAFWGAGGYPEDASLGEDLILARRLRDLHVAEADPIALGFKPYYLFAPWNNEHFSYRHKDYATWPDQLPPVAMRSVSAVPHGIPLTENHILPTPIKRPFQNDWWNDKTQ
jgi:hypothetical protein